MGVLPLMELYHKRGHGRHGGHGKPGGPGGLEGPGGKLPVYGLPSGLPLMELYHKKASEMAIHDELHEKPTMLGATYENPFHDYIDAPVMIMLV